MAAAMPQHVPARLATVHAESFMGSTLAQLSSEHRLFTEGVELVASWQREKRGLFPISLSKIPVSERSSPSLRMAYQLPRKGCFKCGNRALSFTFNLCSPNKLLIQLVISPRPAHLTRDYATIVVNLDTSLPHARLLGPLPQNSVILAVG